jgi:hypothetical protein
MAGEVGRKEGQDMSLRSTLLGVVAGVALIAGASGQASAVPTTFTWSPSGIGLTGGDIVGANNMTGSDFADIVFNPLNNQFSENGDILLTNFFHNGIPVAASGLGGTYSLYIQFSGTGTLNGLPGAPNTSTSGTFSTLNFTVFATNGAFPSITPVPGGTPTVDIGAGNTQVALAFGTLQSGTVTLTETSGGGFSPTANLNLNITGCTGTGGVCTGDESKFFVSPTIADINLVVGNFSATDTVTVLTPGIPTDIDITGGGANLTLAVPEPTTLALFGAGLLGISLIRRRSKQA